MKAIQMVLEFHEAYDCPVLHTPTIPTQDRSRLRQDLMTEELNELCNAIDAKDMVGIVDGLCDLLYVVYGTAWEFGVAELLKEAFAEVHRSNMSKLGQDGKPIYREDGKVLKGPNFTPPNLITIIQKYSDSY